jgi:hypothetical protein
MNGLSFAPRRMIEFVGGEINVCILRRHDGAHAIWQLSVHSITKQKPDRKEGLDRMTLV